MSFRRCIAVGALILRIQMRRVLMEDGEWMLTVNSIGNYLIFHNHDADPSARLVAGNVCCFCLVKAPAALSGMMELCKWER